MYPGRSAQPVRVPLELQGASPYVLEQYVRERLQQFVSSLRHRVAMQVPQEVFDREVANTYTVLPPPEYGAVALENRDLQLVFRHDCQALGCSSEQCSLCHHNAQRRCLVNFDRKYLVLDSLKAKCGAVIRVELVDRASGQVFTEEISGLELEMSILDGNEYDKRVLDRRLAPDQERQELMDCVLPLNKKQEQLLVSAVGVVKAAEGRLIAPFEGSRMELPELSVTDSSEALLTGRKPPFRLLVMAVDRLGRNLKIRHAVSEGFVVATRRTRAAGKVDIPSIDDNVSKLDHMGKETVKKLASLKRAGDQVRISLDIPPGIPDSIERVGDFKWLAQVAEQDGTLRQKLQQVLKLSKEKWEDARDHAMKAVVPDNRMRAWYSDLHNDQQGLLFTCRMGTIDLSRPVALLHRQDQNIQAILVDQLDPRQREELRTLLSQAEQAWWKHLHPGWSLCGYNSEVFLQSGRLEPIGQLPDMPIPGSSQTVHRAKQGTQVSEPRTPPSALQLRQTRSAFEQPPCSPEEGNIARILSMPNTSRALVSEHNIDLPSTSNLGQPDQPISKGDPDDRTYSAFENGFASLPSIPSLPSLFNAIKDGQFETNLLQPHPEMSWNLNQHGNDVGAVPKSMELPTSLEDAYYKRIDQSTGLDSMQSVEESLKGVEKDIDGQKSMEGIDYCSHGEP